MSEQRKPRLKITPENYEGLRKMVGVLPKYSKGNDAVREAMNISSGTWHYLRNSNDYEHFKKLKAAAAPKPEQLQLATDGVVKPRPSMVEFPTAPVVVTNEVAEELRNLNKTLIRLCVAWESSPTKKGWLK